MPKKIKVTEAFLRLTPAIPSKVDGRTDEQQTSRRARRGFPECDSVVWFQAVNEALRSKLLVAGQIVSHVYIILHAYGGCHYVFRIQ